MATLFGDMLNSFFRWVLYKPVSVKCLERIIEPRRFVNFTVEGHNSFVSACFLTHNCDDVLDEHDAMSKTAKDKLWENYGQGIYSRRMPEHNTIIITNTRWAVDDLSGRLLAQEVLDPQADKWVVLKIPAVLDDETAAELTRISRDPRYEKYLRTEEHPEPILYKAGDSFAPRRWPLGELLRSKRNMTKKAWAALYQQSPYEDDGGILKRNDWRLWKGDAPPPVDYVVQVYDTAFETEEKNDYSARTTWGIFRRPEDNVYSAILLERWKDRVSFPDLRAEAYRSYMEYRPDRVLIEKKASGHSLVQELKRKGVPITAVKVKDSKVARAHAASIAFEQGCVFYMDRKWADEVVEECASFPQGKHDDIVDTVTHALNWLRRTYHLYLADEEDDENDTNPVQQLHRYRRRTAMERRA